MSKNIPTDIESLLIAYDRAIGRFNGSSRETNRLLKMGSLLENKILEGKNTGTPSVDLSYAYNGVVKALTNLRNVFAQSSHGNLDELFAQLKQKGVIINPARLPLIPPGKGEIRTGSKKGIKIIKEPRLSWVIDALLKNGIKTDEFFLEPGLPVPGAFRKEPYVLINLPGYGDDGRQIAVCDLYGAAVCVSERIYAPEFYATHTTKELQSIPGIEAIELHDRDQWETDILDFLDKGLETESIHTPNIQAEAQKSREQRIHITPDMIFAKLLEVSLDEKGAFYQNFPSPDSSEEILGWYGWEWKQLSSHLRNYTDYAGIGSLRNHYIAQQAQKWLKTHPEHPRDEIPPSESFLPDYPHVTFGHIDNTLQGIKGRGKTNLWRVLVTANTPVIEGEYIEEPSSDMIFAKLLEVTLDEKGLFYQKFPRTESREGIPGWRSWYWNLLYKYVSNHTDYANPADLRNHYIAQQAQKWLKAHPEHPRDEIPPVESHLPDYPHVTFGHIDASLQSIKAIGKIDLWRVLVTANPPVIEGEYIESPSADMIFAKMLEVSLDEKGKFYQKFPSGRGKEDIQGWRDWTWETINNYIVGHLNYASSVNLREHYITQQAGKWLEAHPEHPKDEIPPAEVKLPDYEYVTFGYIDNALQSINARGRRDLWRVLVTANPPVIEGEYIERPSIDMIFAKMLEVSLDKQGEFYRSFPSGGTKKVVLGWCGWNWKEVNSYVNRSLGYVGILELREHYITQQAQKWLDAHPKHPRDEIPPAEAKLPDYPHVTFGYIDASLRSMKSAGKTDLWRVLVTANPPVIEGEYIEQPSPDMIFAKLLEVSLDEQGALYQSFPSVANKKAILGWCSWSWEQIDRYIKSYTGYVGIIDLRNHYIAEQAQKWLKAHPEHPRDEIPPVESHLPDYPHITFGHIDVALLGGKSTARTDLWRVLVTANPPVIEGEYIEQPSPDMIFAKLLEVSLDEQGEFYRSFPSVGNRSAVLGWHSWNWQDINNSINKYLGYVGMLDLRNHYIVQQAQKWLKTHPEHPRDEIPPAESALPDYPHVTFGHIDNALQSIKSVGKTNLLLLLSKHEVLKCGKDGRSVSQDLPKYNF